MLTFEEALKEAIKNPDLIREFNRLQGTTIGVDKRAPIERMIDKATGYQEIIDQKAQAEFHQFAMFVFEYVYLPVLIEYFKGVK